MDSDGSNQTLAFQYNYNAILSETKLLTTGRIENSGVIRSREVKVWKQSESRAIAKKTLLLSLVISYWAVVILAVT